jgi:peptide/nickel transport system substrate-binding protein
MADLDNAYPYDQAQRRAARRAGYANGFTLNVPLLPTTESIMAMVKQQLGDVGITVTPPRPQASYVTDIIAAKFPVAWFSIFQGEPWVAIRQLITTDAAYNPFKTTSPSCRPTSTRCRPVATRAVSFAQKVNKYVVDQVGSRPSTG